MSLALARALGGLLGAAVATLALCGCSAQQNGPLEGPRVERDAVEVCAAAGAGRDIYFSEPITNTGNVALTVGKVAGSGNNLGQVDYYFDSVGPARDQVLGTFAGPATERDGDAKDVLSRMVEAPGLVVDAGQTVALIVHVVPILSSEDARVSETSVTYTSGREHYQEQILVNYRVHPGEAC